MYWWYGEKILETRRIMKHETIKHEQDDFISFLGGKDNLPSESNLELLLGGLDNDENRRAFTFVSDKDPQWIEQARKRNCNDSANIRSYLGELRAYSDLLKFSLYHVKPNSLSKGKGADFELTDKRTGQKIEVEVYTQGLKPNCIKPSEKEVMGWMMEQTVTPLVNWGTAKSDYSVAQHTIRNIAGSKKDAHQVNTETPTYLYIDFQAIWGFDCAQSLPILSQGEQLTTGVCWLAFYGRKGMPILENFRFGEPVGNLREMTDDGIFFREPSCRFAGALLRSKLNGENPLVFLENPSLKTPEHFVCALIQSGLMNMEKSCWGREVASQVNSFTEKIKNIILWFKRLQESMLKQEP